MPSQLSSHLDSFSLMPSTSLLAVKEGKMSRLPGKEENIENTLHCRPCALPVHRAAPSGSPALFLLCATTLQHCSANVSRTEPRFLQLRTRSPTC